MAGNLLGAETSPYLLQHKDNPVHWRPWGEAAFAEARAADKPILLSVGYAACHWCHVMAHESFEDAETAALMNAHYVPVKVDREERPDVDMLYQRALGMMGEAGGWPLTMFLTPAGEPFWGGTYFPPQALYGRPAFRTVLSELARAYHEQPEKVRQSADLLRQALSGPTTAADAADGVVLSMAILDRAADQLVEHVDLQEGGLQGAPKFPMPFVFAFLWRAWRRTGTKALRDAVTLTLTRMARGGIWDHLGGGFARYSTDGRWLVPHFEKMLYDNAQLIELMTEVWQETGDALLADRVEATVAWVEREMIAEAGAFAATLDADTEGAEGAFYVWTEQDLRRALPDDDDAALVGRVYDVTREGNREDGTSVLHRNHPGGGPGDWDETRLARLRAALFEARRQRPAPARDDKVLADWNGLMIAALARAGGAFGRVDWVRRAETAFAGVVTLLGRPGARLAHATRASKTVEAGLLDDYAAMARAALLLHQATGRRDLIDQAAAWAETAHALFHDDREGGWFVTAAEETTLIARPRSVVDNAVPSGAGMMVEVCARLFWLTGDDRWAERADDGIGGFTAEAVRQFPSSATLLNAFELRQAAVQVVVVGSPADPATAALRGAALRAPAPLLVLQAIDPETPLPASHPAAGKGLVDGRPAAYVCVGPTCSAPVTAPEALRAGLAEGYSGSS